MAMASGEWLEKALLEISGKMETSGLDLDADLISGLVSFCELAPPPDAADYLTNIIGVEAGEHIIQGYLQKRGHVDSSRSTQSTEQLNVHAYVKPPAGEGVSSAKKKQTRIPKEAVVPATKDTKHQAETAGPSNSSRGNASNPKKKRSGKAISLAEAAKGSVVFQQGQPCSCQARRHKLVSNCLSCGKIVCEQEGEGPCSFCGALVLKEGSTYAGLEDLVVPLSDAEASAEAYAKRLVDYDRNSAARTKVIDDQSDYYEIEGNSWLSMEEKELLKKKQQEIKDADEARRKKLVVTFDLVGRKVIMDRDEASESENRIFRPLEERDLNRIKPNPTIREQPVFVSTGPSRDPAKGKQKKHVKNGLCLEISGRVQHDHSKISHLANDGQNSGSTSSVGHWSGPQPSTSFSHEDDVECSLDYN